MSTKEQRVEVFNDTQSWINSDTDLSASVSYAKNHTTVYYEDDYPVFDSGKVKDTKITVSGYRSFEAAMKLHADNPESKIAVMNFANAFHAGGGVTKGASAQEECLCRTSTSRRRHYRRPSGARARKGRPRCSRRGNVSGCRREAYPLSQEEMGIAVG